MILVKKRRVLSEFEEEGWPAVPPISPTRSITSEWCSSRNVILY